MKKEIIQSMLRLIIALIIGLIVSSIFIVCAGENPLEAYQAMLEGAFVGKLNILTTLRWSVPYILSGFASAVAIRAGMFNMGLEGCIYLGGLAAGIAGAHIKNLPSGIHIALCILIAMAVGIIWMYIPSRLKAYHGVNEVIMTWMMSYIAVLLCQFLAAEVFQKKEDITSAVQQVRTPEILESAKLSQLIPPYQLNTSLLIAIGLCVLYYLFANRTKIGYEQKILGTAPKFAEYGGVKVKKIQFYSLLISGALGALTGALEVLGVHYRYVHGFALDMGSNGILVSLM